MIKVSDYWMKWLDKLFVENPLGKANEKCIILYYEKIHTSILLRSAVRMSGLLSCVSSDSCEK